MLSISAKILSWSWLKNVFCADLLYGNVGPVDVQDRTLENRIKKHLPIKLI